MKTLNEQVGEKLKLLNEWINTIQGFNATDFNYFRGVADTNEMIDLYNIRYEGV